MSAPLLQQWHRQIEAILGTSIEWSPDSGGKSFLTCPWYDKHSRNGQRDSFLVMEWVGKKVTNLYAHCSHDSCKGKWKDTNQLLRNQFGLPHPKPNGELKSAHKSVHELEKQRPKLIEHYKDKLRPLPGVKLTSIEVLCRLFQPDDYLWIAEDETRSGGEWARGYFKALKEWCKSPPPPWFSFFCPNVLKPGSVSRSNENVLEPLRYLVLEMDGTPLSEQRAMIEVVEEIFFPGRLEMITFSGHESLHSCWRHPGKEWLLNNKPALKALGFCDGPMRESQPVRLPGAMNTKHHKRQELLWLK